jgi:precorrin-2/cobalt-factor-2 C20-methyltransferase
MLVGDAGDEVQSGVAKLCATEAMGYLATLLIRKTPKEKRHT